MRDFNATVLRLLGMNHERFTFKFQGLDQKFTGVVPAKVVYRSLWVEVEGSATNKQTRRSFLTTCSAAAVATALPSVFLPSDLRQVWRSIAGCRFRSAHLRVRARLAGAAGRPGLGRYAWPGQDEQGHIYVGHTVHKSSMRGEAIVVFDEKGRFVRAFGEEFRGGAHGLRLRREGKDEFLYHCDINRCRIVKTTLTGEEIWMHGYPREDASYAERPIDFVPTNVAFAPNGDFYVGDGYGSNHMLRFSLAGKFLGEIGRPGHDDGEFDTPHGQWVDPRGETPLLVVADRGNRRIQTFTLDGAHLKTIKDEARLRMPCNFHTQGEWMVCPDLDSQVCILDRRVQRGCATRRRQEQRTVKSDLAEAVALAIHSGKVHHAARRHLSSQRRHSRSRMAADRANHTSAQGLTGSACHFESGCGRWSAELAAIFLLVVLLVFAPPDGRERVDLAQFLGRFHPLIVHIPIALLLLVPMLECAGFLSRTSPTSGGLRAGNRSRDRDRRCRVWMAPRLERRF